MELIFEKNNDWYVCEFEVTKDFNIHIEKKVGDILFYQKTSGVQYDHIENIGVSKGGDPIIDVDFVSAIYPKQIMIKSRVLPDLAVVTFAQ